MKKFLTFLIVLIVVFTFGLVILRLLRDEETISITATNAYYNTGEQISFDYKVEHKNKSSKIDITSSDESIVKKQDNGTFVAVGGGVCQIILTHTNPRNIVTTLAKDVMVGDGTEANPYFVRTEAELRAIGEGTEEELKTKLNAHYVQTVNITLTSNFKPIDGTLTGSYKGILIDDNSSVTKKSYVKIINYTVTSDENSSENTLFTSMFRNIGPTGKFGYVTFENVNINGNFENASVVCVKNEGLIDFVTVTGAIETTSNTDNTKIASIAIENSYIKAEGNQVVTKAQISRCRNTATLTTAGHRAAGIVYQNKANVLFCVNGSEVSDNGKITANGVDLIAGGIVGENTYGFGDDLKNAMANTSLDTEEKDALIADELEFRPQVKDCYSKGIIRAEKSGNAFVGGIIGLETQGHNKQTQDTFDQLYDNLTMGNYYLINDGAIFDRGVGNLSYTQEKKDGESGGINIYDYTTDFVAIGLDGDQLTNGILTTVNGEQVRASLLSYYQDGNRVTWKDENVYAFYIVNGVSQLPFLRQTETYFNQLSYRLPYTRVATSEIDSLNKFLTTDFTQTTPSGNPKEYRITNWIEFDDTTNGNTGYEYYKLKGREPNETTGIKAAQFILRADPIPDTVNGGYLTDENGNTLYYGFKNFSGAFTKDARYSGLFGYILNSTIENVTFIDCGVSAVDGETPEQTTRAVGLVAGYAGNSTFNNLIFSSTEENSACITEMAERTILGGGIVGEFVDSNMSQIKGVLSVTANGSTQTSAYAGGLVGRSIKSSYSNINCQVDISVAESVSAGGFAGSIQGGQTTTVKLNSRVTGGGSVGGFASTLSGAEVSLVSMQSTISAVSSAAGVAVIAEDGANFNNSSVTTIFEGGADQCGLFSTLGNNSQASSVIFTNNFNSQLGTRYAKTKNVTGQIFANDTISDAGRNRAKGAGDLINCFVFNKVQGSVNYNRGTTIFYAEQLVAAINVSQDRAMDPTAKAYTDFSIIIPQIHVVYGIYGAGILNAAGLLYNAESERYNRNFNDYKDTFGFTSEWDFSGFPTLNI